MLGGDSILSISVSIAARKAGLRLSPGDVFRARTPAALAQLAPPRAAPAEPEPSSARGRRRHRRRPAAARRPSPARERRPDRPLQPVPARPDARPALRPEQLAAVLQALLDHHDALRLRLQRIAGVLWTLEARAARHRARGRPADARRRARAGAGGAARDDRRAVRCRDRAAGSRRRAGCSRRSGSTRATGEPGRLLLAAHHLAVDGVSWRILLDDLAEAWEAVQAGGPPALAPVGDVAARVRPDRRRAGPHAAAPGRGRPLAPDARRRAPTSCPARRSTPPRRTPSQTRSRCRRTRPRRCCGAGVTERLLAALALAVARWRTAVATRARELLVDLERHGREPLDGADLSRTVGWFTAIHPAPPARPTGPDASRAARRGHRAPARDPRQRHRLRDAALRQRPGRAAARAVSAPAGALQLLRALPGGPGRRLAARPGVRRARHVAPDGEQGLPYLLALDVVCADEPDGPRLRATWTRTAGGLVGRRTCSALQAGWVEALRELAALPAQPDAAPRLTPADVTTVALTQEQIDAVRRAAAPTEVEDIWRLSPLQEGLYFHATFDEGELDVYTAQTSLDFERGIDVERLRAACGGAAARATRACARASSATASPSRCRSIAREPRTPIEVVDLAELDPAARRARLHELMDADRTRRFDLARPPLHADARRAPRRRHRPARDHEPPRAVGRLVAGDPARPAARALRVAAATTPGCRCPAPTATTSRGCRPATASAAARRLARGARRPAGADARRPGRPRAGADDPELLPHRAVQRAQRAPAPPRGRPRRHPEHAADGGLGPRPLRRSSAATTSSSG